MRAQDLEGVAHRSRSAYAQTLPIVKRYGRLAFAHEFIGGQHDEEVGHGIPMRHIGQQGRVLHYGIGGSGMLLQFAERQERQGVHHPGGVLARMVEVAYVRHLNGAELDRVEVLLVLGEHLAVADLDGELAARTLLENGGDSLDAFGVGAAFAPVGMAPFDDRAIDRLCKDRAVGK